MLPPKAKRRVWNKTTGRTYGGTVAAYDASPARTKARAERNAARYKMKKLGKVKVGDGKDVDHKAGLKAGNKLLNLRPLAASKNRSYKRAGPGGKLKKQNY
jgi:hypothetical protein